MVDNNMKESINKSSQVVDTKQVLCKACRAFLSLILLPPCSLAISSPVPNLVSEKALAMPDSGRSVFVNFQPSLKNSQPLQIECANPVVSAHGDVDATLLPLEWALSPKGASLSQIRDARRDESYDFIVDRAIARLTQLQLREPNPHTGTELRLAEITILYASQGHADPFRDACLGILHCQPEQVWPNVLANRQLRLGDEYSDWYDAAGNLKPDIPKIPSRLAVEKAGADLAPQPPIKKAAPVQIPRKEIA